MFNYPGEYAQIPVKPLVTGRLGAKLGATGGNAVPLRAINLLVILSGEGKNPILLRMFGELPPRKCLKCFLGPKDIKDELKMSKLYKIVQTLILQCLSYACHCDWISHGIA